MAQHMDELTDFCIVLVYAGDKANGQAFFEELPAVYISANIYRLLRSPGLALNLARGDIVEISGKPEPAKVLARGGNFCIQIYDLKDTSGVDGMEQHVRDNLGGSLDGMKGGNLSFSIPSTNEMVYINKVFDALKLKYGCEWYYANIYENFDDLDDDTLLNWWVEQ